MHTHECPTCENRFECAFGAECGLPDAVECGRCDREPDYMGSTADELHGMAFELKRRLNS